MLCKIERDREAAREKARARERYFCKRLDAAPQAWDGWYAWQQAAGRKPPATGTEAYRIMRDVFISGWGAMARWAEENPEPLQ